MQKPINEQYYDLWKRLDEVWDQGREEQLTSWNKEINTQIKQLQERVVQLDLNAIQKWLKFFRPVYDKILESHHHLEFEPRRQLSKYLFFIQSGIKLKLSVKLLKLFQSMEFEVQKEPGKCNCQLKHDMKMILNEMADMDVENMKKWQNHFPAVIFQCQDCGIYWSRNQRNMDINGVNWEFLGKNVDKKLL